ncbi:hypothetical protein A4R44_00672 [Amycolatopsis sp. M39]|nr:hypothetical protein A4R44_00672 [Amycolatopsis sp. M39]
MAPGGCCPAISSHPRRLPAIAALRSAATPGDSQRLPHGNQQPPPATPSGCRTAITNHPRRPPAAAARQSATTPDDSRWLPRGNWHPPGGCRTAIGTLPAAPGDYRTATALRQAPGGCRGWLPPFSGRRSDHPPDRLPLGNSRRAAVLAACARRRSPSGCPVNTGSASVTRSPGVRRPVVAAEDRLPGDSTVIGPARNRRADHRNNVTCCLLLTGHALCSTVDHPLL